MQNPSNQTPQAPKKPRKKRMFDLRTRDVIFGVILLLMLVYINNYSLTLARIGFNPAGTRLIDSGICFSGKEYRIVVNERGDHKNPYLACLEKSKLGIWEICEVQTLQDEHGIVWLSQYSSDFGNQDHIYACVCNPKRYLPRTLTAYLPGGVSAEVEHGENYSIVHLAWNDSYTQFGYNDFLDVLYNDLKIMRE